MFADIVEVSNCFRKVHSIDCLSSFTGVFEVHTEVRSACFGGFGWVDRGCCVADHGGKKERVVRVVRVVRMVVLVMWYGRPVTCGALILVM